jgi:hypothetical protein
MLERVHRFIDLIWKTGGLTWDTTSNPFGDALCVAGSIHRRYKKYKGDLHPVGIECPNSCANQSPDRA